MASRKVPEWLTGWEYAHRGAHSIGMPENSLAAARAALAAGLGIECDIQRAADGRPMVFHDWELDRLTDKSGQIGELSSNHLGEIRLRANNEPIPSLRHFLQEVGGRVPLLIEIKSKPDYNVDASCLAVAEELDGYAGDYAVMSFDPRVAEWFREHAPDTLIGLVMREDEMGHTQMTAEREDALAKAQPDFLAYHIAALPSPWVAQLRADGLPVLTWTVNSPEGRERALKHADALIAEGTGLV